MVLLLVDEILGYLVETTFESYRAVDLKLSALVCLTPAVTHCIAMIHRAEHEHPLCQSLATALT